MGKQQSFFMRPVKNSQKASEASSRALHVLIQNKIAFLNREVLERAVMVIANPVFKDKKNGPDVIPALSDVQLGASMIVYKSVSYVRKLDRAAGPGSG